MYLKNQKLDKPFDEETFFSEAKRVLKRKGFVVMFGRGTAFYRWNTRLADLGFSFKEEVIWNKRYISNPGNNLLRVHETISIFASDNAPINKVYVPYLEARQYDFDKLVTDVKRLAVTFNNFKELQAVNEYVNKNKMLLFKPAPKHNVTINQKYTRSRCANVAKAIKEGCVLKSIITEASDHYTMQHPTQKPVRLMERLSALVTQEGDLVLDPFMGSGSTGIACINTGRRFIGYEIDDEYFGIAKGRLEEAKAEKSTELF